MERFLALHITNDDLNVAIVRRSMKIYIENFDPERVYLLESEAAPYLHFSDRKADEILSRLKKHDYSDFIALNQLIQRSILRAEMMRRDLLPQMAQPSYNLEISFTGVSSHFARSEEEILQRQQNRMSRFFAFHQARSHLDTVERRGKVFMLFEKKVRRGEYSYLFLNQDGKALSQGQIEHLMAVRILKSFAKSLDTHTSFFSPEEANEMRMGLEKQFNGVGVILSEGVDGIMIADLIQGSPAEQSGQIQVNDFLVEIDRTPVHSVSFEEVMEILKRKGREEIVLGFKRIDASSQKEIFYRVPLRKQPIVMTDARIQTGFARTQTGIIGKISLHSFYESASGVTSERDIKQAIRSFREQGNLEGLVLDLRENSGGFLSQAVKVAGLFISNGIVVISKYGKGETHYLRNISGKSFFSGPLVILTSKMSASAAEIVAQALQDYGVGIVVGDTRTFGKGSIQYQTITDPSADLFFKVTVGRYYTASGKTPQVEGVIADIVVPTQYAPYNIGEKFLEYPLSPDRVEAVYVDPLTDLDSRTRQIFEERYIPYLQRSVAFWKNHMSDLKAKSAKRLEKSPEFQALFKHQEGVRARLKGIPVNTVDEPIQNDMHDPQMEEAVYIVVDMLQIEQSQLQREEELLPTGS